MQKLKCKKTLKWLINVAFEKCQLCGKWTSADCGACRERRKHSIDYGSNSLPAQGTFSQMKSRDQMADKENND